MTVTPIGKCAYNVLAALSARSGDVNTNMGGKGAWRKSARHATNTSVRSVSDS